MAFNFNKRDCDALGARLYSVDKNIPAFQVTSAQIELYKEGYLRMESDIDGMVGPGTLAAIAAYNRDRDNGDTATNEGMPEAKAEKAIDVLKNVPHYSQAAPLIADIKLGMHEGADPCRRSGCLSTAVWCCMASHRDEDFPAIDSFIEHLASCECYTDRSLLLTQKACEEFAFDYQRDIPDWAAQGHLKGGAPVILRISKDGHTHFVIAIGYDEVRGYAVHDPGTQWGNFYKQPRYVLSRDVTRYDAVIPKEVA